MLLSLLLAYAAIASAGCARRGQPQGGKISINLHGTQSPAQNQSWNSTSSITSSTVLSTTISSPTSSSISTTSSIITTTSSSTSSSTSAASSSASAQSVKPAGKVAEKIVSASGDSGAGSQFTASFTHYSGCSSPVVACGFVNSKSGYTAAISESFFGAAPGAGAGPGCSKCWHLSSSTAGTKSITVQINNLCPSDGNAAMCAQSGLKGTNSVGMNVNFDLCEDDGTSTAFFGGASVGMSTGTAIEVAC